MDRATYNRIEQGHSGGLDSLIMIADATGVSLADLVRQ
ncbi:helix-turn-helix domain-containing protein [Streptomyces sp. A3M-1-3]|nr:helix-turn-helix domain-containing protein [Streptomyces sp. A3M-1-3]MCP3821956.1 helix-turn-helix domain-containing protein [Streptomyces sp. A3M-1-3]